MHSSDFLDSELLEDDSSSELLFEDLLEDDSPSIPRSFPRCSASSWKIDSFLGTKI